MSCNSTPQVSCGYAIHGRDVCIQHNPLAAKVVTFLLKPIEQGMSGHMEVLSSAAFAGRGKQLPGGIKIGDALFPCHAAYLRRHFSLPRPHFF